MATREPNSNIQRIQTLTGYVDRLEARFSRDPLFYFGLEGEPNLPDNKSSIIFVNETYSKVLDFFKKECGYSIVKSDKHNLGMSKDLQFTDVDFVSIPPYQTTFRLYHREDFKRVEAMKSVPPWGGILLWEATPDSGVVWKIQCHTWAHCRESMLVWGDFKGLDALFHEMVGAAYTDEDWRKIETTFSDSAYRGREEILNEYPGTFSNFVSAQTIIPLLHSLSQSDLALYLDAGTHMKLDDILVHGDVPLPGGLEVASKVESRKHSRK